MKTIYPFQLKGKTQCNKILNASRNGVLCMPTGCISWDSVINLNRKKKGYKRNIKQLFKSFYSVYKKNGHPTFSRSFNEETIQLNEIESVSYSGVKFLLKLELENGLTLKATPDHKIMTKSGWKELNHIDEDDLIMCDKLKAKKKNKIKPKPIYTQVEAVWFHPYSNLKFRKDRNSYMKVIEKHRLVFEAYINGLSYEEFINTIRFNYYESKNLIYIDPELFHIHHKDSNSKNNDIKNLECLTKKQHHKIHSKKNKFNFNQGFPEFVKVKSIEDFGHDHTYDIGCYNNHNFVANGIVVHNSGKTFTACKLIKDRINLNEKIWVIPPQIEIFDQWFLELNQNKISTGYINQQGIIGRDKDVYICMPMSLNNILSVIPENFKPDGIITDEAHHSMAASWQNIYNFYGNAWKLGLTATPERTDGQGLDYIYDELVIPITIKEAIEQNFLSEPLTIVPEEHYASIPIPVNDTDFDLRKQADLLGKTKIIGNVIEQYSNVFCGLPVIVACSTYDHAEMMTESFNQAGWNFAHIHSKLNEYDRSKILQGIRTGKLNGICTVGIGVEGLDIPGLYGLIWLRRTMSITIYLQFIGRVLRKMEGKQFGIILDFVGNVFIHGRPDMNRAWTLKGRSERLKNENDSLKMKICPNCKVMNSISNLYCHICRNDFENKENLSVGRELPTMVDGKLLILDSKQLAERKEEILMKLKEQRKVVMAEKEKENLPETLDKNEKLDILKNGLNKKRGLMNDAIKSFF